MKKIFTLLVIAVFTVFTMGSCTDEKQEQSQNQENVQLEWSFNAVAQGDGQIKVSYPTGYLDLTGNAKLQVMSSNELLISNSEAVSPAYVLNNPSEYTEDQLKAAEEVKSAFNVDTITGNYNLDITGYAKYGSMYFVIDEHFPKDSIQ